MICHSRLKLIVSFYLGDDGILADGPPNAVFADSEAWHEAGLIVPNWIFAREEIMNNE